MYTSYPYIACQPHSIAVLDVSALKGHALFAALCDATAESQGMHVACWTRGCLLRALDLFDPDQALRYGGRANWELHVRTGVG